MVRKIAAGALLLFLAGAAASAETVTYSFQGYVNNAFYFAPGYTVWYAPGTSASGDFTIALPATDSSSDPGIGAYESSPIISGDLTIGTDSISLNSSGADSIDILNDGFGFDHVILNYGGIQLFLQDSTGMALSDDYIPTSLNILDFDSATFSFATSDFSHDINGSVTALSVSVNNSPAPAPLPNAVWGGMVLMGCIAAQRIRRKIVSA